MTTYSYIDAAITAISERNGQMATIANICQKQVGAASPAHTIAMAYVTIKHRQLEWHKQQPAGVKLSDYPEVKPETCLLFVQQLQNRICWLSRSIYVAQSEEDEKDVANGIDFSADKLEELDLEPVDTDHIKDLVDDDFATLTAVNSYLCKKMSYLDTLPVLEYYKHDAFNESTQEWETKAVAVNYDEAMAIIQDIIDARKEEDAEAEYKEAANMSFK